MDPLARPAPETERPPRILVVDDDPNVRAVFGDYLNLQGHEVVFANTAISGLETARRLQPDVLLDLMMPGAVTGDAVIEAISKVAPVIVSTALHDIDRARDTLRHGAFDFVTKPVPLDHLNDVVNAALLHRRRDDGESWHRGR